MRSSPTTTTLLEAGAHIHLYYGNFLHAKHATIDDCVALIGSSNLDIRSFALNNEISVLVYDRAVVSALCAIQARYFAESEQVDRVRWSKRHIATRAAQNIARLADSLL